VRWSLISIPFALLALLAAPAHADSIYGSCVRPDGSKCDGAARISTSWNGKQAFPRGGRYRLDFGGTVGKRITVYCDGSSVGSIVVKGEARLDVVCR